MGGPRSRTVAVHAGERLKGSRSHPLSAPVYLSAVAYCDDAESLDAALEGGDYVYTRIRGQNAELLEEAVAALEGTEACAAFSTGMAALRAVFDAQGFKAGDTVVAASDGYGVTRALFKALCAERGVRLEAIAFAAPDAAERIRAAAPRLVVAESITNPLLAVPDICALAEATHAVGGLLAVDATFASPMVQQACALGADYAVQSTTKWINGHSDAMGGTVAGASHRIQPLKNARVLQGAILGPFEAWLTLRGLRTLPVRMAAHCENALLLAQRLSASPLLERVLYPGLPSHPDHAVAQRVLRDGFGGMLAFEIQGADRAKAFLFLEQVKIAKAAPSLGDVATLVMHPVTAAARRMTSAEREAAGIRENLIRVSVGLEDVDDLAEDLLGAVARAMESGR
ncbi:MAG: PLP-dependent aspartate aminotransferase family protein [Myxococcota bacterium]|nr:PLP-dependent aspartate aminotransferase family protein [Myxococcota bacterium]